ncbi:TetR/AcrR family transcriptional regulator C-terminal domain-containing protein [Nonomuraea antimicrobica]
MAAPPWVATVHRSLLAPGPNQLRLIERVMGVLDPCLSIDENLGLMAILNGYVESAAREEVSRAEEVRRSGLSEPEWLARSYPYVERLLSSGDYPIFTKIATDTRHLRLGRDDQFRYGLERVLDCIAAALPPTPRAASDGRTTTIEPGLRRWARRPPR